MTTYSAQLYPVLGMVMYANELKTKENQKLTEIKN